MRNQAYKVVRTVPLARDLSIDCTAQTFQGAFATLPATVGATLANNAGFNDSGVRQRPWTRRPFIEEI